MIALPFMSLIIKILYFKYRQFVIYKMAILSKIKSHSDVIDYFIELAFYNKPIKKLKVKRSKDIDQIIELPFYEQMDVIKIDEAFRGYAMSYKVQIVERKDPIIQLKAEKLRIENWFHDILNETKGFMYQITLKNLFK